MIEKQIKKLIDQCSTLNIPLTNDQVIKFTNYLVSLLAWNKRINLVSKKDEQHIVDRHFFESIAVFNGVHFPCNSQIVDVGTGAGFPGIPLKIVRPEIMLTLVESKRMKALFLDDLISKLNLNDVRIINERAEKVCLLPEYSKRYDFVIARAVSSLKKLYEWTKPFLKPGAKILAIKGGDINDEINELKDRFNQVEVDVMNVHSNLISFERKLCIVQME